MKDRTEDYYYKFFDDVTVIRIFILKREKLTQKDRPSCIIRNSIMYILNTILLQ